MGALSSLLPLIVLFVVIGVLAFVGYGFYTWSQELSERANKKMEKKNVSFTKDGGLRVGVKEVKTEDYADKTQRALVNTWNASYSDSTKSGGGGSGSSTPRPSGSRTGTSSSTSKGTSSSSGLAAPESSSKHRSTSPVPGGW